MTTKKEDNLKEDVQSKDVLINFTEAEAEHFLSLLDALVREGGIKYSKHCLYFYQKIQKEFSK